MPFVIEDGRFSSYYRNIGSFAEPAHSDIIFILDLPLPDELEFIVSHAQSLNVKIVSLIYDLIPIQHPYFVTPAFADVFRTSTDFLMRHSDAVIAISRSVAMEVQEYVGTLERQSPLGIGWCHLGADFAASAPIAEIKARPFFLGVGTIEPRKAWSVAIDAMEKLWHAGIDADFVLVGRPGQNSFALQYRIERHLEYGKRLIWLRDADDDTLSQLYRTTSAVVSTSVCEGFGLPIVEARNFGAGVIASDLPVFREIGQDDVTYFSMLDADQLAWKLKDALDRRGTVKSRSDRSWESAATEMFALVRDLALGRPNPGRL